MVKVSRYGKSEAETASLKSADAGITGARDDSSTALQHARVQIMYIQYILPPSLPSFLPSMRDASVHLLCNSATPGLPLILE